MVSNIWQALAGGEETADRVRAARAAALALDDPDATILVGSSNMAAQLADAVAVSHGGQGGALPEGSRAGAYTRSLLSST
jgi:hypothetical protein